MTIDAVLSFLAVGIMLWFFYGPWQTLCVDFTRQLLFEQRDALFDIALSGRISFDDPVYVSMRQSMQRSIRFAHMMTVPRVIFLAFAFGGIGRGGSRLRTSALDVVDSELRKDLIKITNAAAAIVTGSVLARSLVFLIIIPEAFIAFLILKTFDRCRRKMVQQLNKFGDLVQKEAEFTS